MKAIELLARDFADRHPEEAAVALEGLDPAEAARAVERLSGSAAGAVIAKLRPQTAAAILGKLPQESTQRLFRSMPVQAAALVFQHIEEARREDAFNALPEAAARQIRELLKYPEDTAGGMMDPRVTTIPADFTCQQAIGAIRRAPRETLHYLYVTDREGRLVGVMTLRDLLLCAPREPVEKWMRRDVLTAPASLDREEVARRLRDRGLLALPVTDAEGRLLGVVKLDQAASAVQEEAFEDMQRMAGAGGDERAYSPVSTLVKRRLPWLTLNLVTAFIAAAVVGIFESTIARITALAVLLPIVAGQGGNTGAQSLAVVMRGLALREIRPGGSRRLLLKELAGGVINGAAIAVVTGAGVLMWDGRPALAGVIAASMLINMAAAALAGGAIPLVLRALGRDPAQSSAIFLTTLTDIVGFGSFLGFAALMEPWLAGPA